MTAQSPLRIGIAGSGFMGRTHTDAASKIESAVPVAIACGSRASKVADDYGIDLMSDYDALLSRDDIDAVVITTPHWLHCEQAIAAANAGKHVLVEKPMATSVPDCERMIEAFAARDLVLSVGYHQRFREGNRRVRELLAEGAIGEVHCIQMSALFDITALRSDPGFGGAWNWWNDPRSIAHLMNSGPHNIDLCRWWLDRDVVTACSQNGTFREDNPNENTTMALLRFSGGAMCSFWSSSVVPQPGFSGEEFRFRIMGERGVIDLDPYNQLILGKDGRSECVFEQPPVNHEEADAAFLMPRMRAYCDQLNAFTRTVATGKPAGEGTARDGKMAVAAVVAMLESAEQQRFISLDKS